MSEPAPRPHPLYGERVEPPRHRVTPAEYLAFEEAHPDKHEYVGGYIYAMAPPTARHQLIAGNVHGHLWTAARSTACRAYIEAGLSAAEDVLRPDVFVVCDRDVEGSAIARDPCLVVEVLSPSTARTDRTAKRATYMALPSVQAYWIVSQDWRSVERHWRGDDRAWRLEILHGDGALPVPCPPRAPLTLDEVYEGLDVPHAPPPPRRVREPEPAGA